MILGKIMKRKKFLIILVITLALLGISTFILQNREAADLSGEVIGPNPNNIPKSQLPECNFNGVKFINLPCYSPPGSTYL